MPGMASTYLYAEAMAGYINIDLTVKVPVATLCIYWCGCPCSGSGATVMDTALVRCEVRLVRVAVRYPFRSKCTVAVTFLKYLATQNQTTEELEKRGCRLPCRMYYFGFLCDNASNTYRMTSSNGAVNHVVRSAERADAPW